MPTLFSTAGMARVARLSVVPSVMAIGLISAGCDWLHDAPEIRARDFVYAMVTDPENRPRLTKLANVEREEQFAALSSTEFDIEMTYLRTRVGQGASIDVSIKAVERPTTAERRVRLDVEIKKPGKRIELRRKTDVTSFNVVLIRDANEWHVKEIHSVN